MILLSLYRSILVPILSDWIIDEDVCCLDTAMSSHKHRTAFQETLKFCCLSEESIVDSKISIGSQKWAVMRKIKHKVLNLCSANDVQYWTEELASVPIIFFSAIRADISHRLVDLLQRYQIRSEKMFVCNQSVDSFLLCQVINLLCCSELTLVQGTKDLLECIDTSCPTITEISVGTYCPSASLGSYCDVALIDLPAIRNINSVEMHVLLEETIDTGRALYYECTLRSNHSVVDAVLSVSGTHYAMTRVHLCHNGTKLITAGLRTVEDLSLAGNKYDDVFSQSFLHGICTVCTRLTVLSVYQVNILEDDMLNLIEQNSLHLRQITVADFLTYGDTLLQKIAKCCSLLNTLTLVNIVTTDSDALNLLLTRCPSLKLSLVHHGPTPIDHVLCSMCNKTLLKLGSSTLCNVREGRLNGLEVQFDFSLDDYKMMFMQGVHLQRIVFLQQYNLLDDSIACLVDACPNLTYVRVFKCGRLTGQSLIHLSKLQYLTSLVLCEQEQITGKHFKALLSNNRLTSLTVIGCDGLTTKVLKLLPKLCSQLKVLDLRDCKKMTDKCVLSLLDRCHSLISLNVQDTPVSTEVLQHRRLQPGHDVRFKGARERIGVWGFDSWD